MRKYIALAGLILLVGGGVWFWYNPLFERHSSAVNCMALNVYWEAAAASESEEGMHMVAYVTHERAKHGRRYWGGRTICGVVRARRTKKNGGIVCQFSWTCMDVKDKTPELRAKHQQALQIAEGQLAGKYKPPVHLIGATSYLNPDASGKRNVSEFAAKLKCLGTVPGSRHIFYRDATETEKKAPATARACA